MSRATISDVLKAVQGLREEVNGLRSEMNHKFERVDDKFERMEDKSEKRFEDQKKNNDEQFRLLDERLKNLERPRSGIVDFLERYPRVAFFLSLLMVGSGSSPIILYVTQRLWS